MIIKIRLKKYILSSLLILLNSSLYAADAQFLSLANALYEVDWIANQYHNGTMNQETYLQDIYDPYYQALDMINSMPFQDLETYQLDLNGGEMVPLITWLIERNVNRIYNPFIKAFLNLKKTSHEYTGIGIFGEELALSRAINDHAEGKINLAQVLIELDKTNAEALDIALACSGKTPLIIWLIRNNINKCYNQLLQAIIAKTIPSARCALNHIDWITQQTPLQVAQAHNLDQNLIAMMRAKGAIEQAPPIPAPLTMEEMDAFVELVRNRAASTTKDTHPEATPEQPRPPKRAAPSAPEIDEPYAKKSRSF